MKHLKLLLFSFFCIITAVSFAQDTVINQNFERWTPSGKPAPFDWQEPEGWTTSNGLTEFVSAGVKKVQYSGSSSFQAELRTLNIFGNTVPSVLINGDFSFTTDDIEQIPMLGGTPATVVKQKLYGRYNFSPTDITDSASVTAIYKKYNTSNQQAEVVAIGNIHLPATQAGLYGFSFDIFPVTTETPDSLVITIVSSNEDEFKDGGVLTIDFVSLTVPTSVKNIEGNSVKATLFPNPTRDNLWVETDKNITTYTITDITGKTLLTGAPGQTTANVNVSALASGYYLLNIETVSGYRSVSFIKE